MIIKKAKNEADQDEKMLLEPDKLTSKIVNDVKIHFPTRLELNELMSIGANDNIEEGEKLAVKFTHDFPNNGLGWKVLGRIYQQQGLVELAEVSLKNAVKYLPKDSEAQYNLGNCYFEQHQYLEAINYYKQAIKLNIRFDKAYSKLANAFKELGLISDAEECYKNALKFNPQNAQLHFDYAQLLYAKRCFKEAALHYQKIIKINPDYSSAHFNLGVTYREMGQLRQAETCYRTALKINPNYALAYNSLGIVLNDLGFSSEAEVNFKKALEINPTYAEGYGNLGLVLGSVGRLQEAEIAYEKALEIEPLNSVFLSNFSVTLTALNQLTRAENLLIKALSLTPNFLDIYINLSVNYLAQGRISDAESACLKALKIKPDCIVANNNLLFAMNYSSTHTVDECLKQVRNYAEILSNNVSKPYITWLKKSEIKRLRVGIVSGDLRKHVVAYFLENMLQHINPSSIELIAYTANVREDEVTARLKPYFSRWKSIVGLSDQSAAELIHQDGIDILMDLSGHTSGNRLPLFAWKPAPVQVSWLGYFATTGMEAIDYFIADEAGVPQSNQHQFIEKIKYLPDTRLCFTAPDVDINTSKLPALVNGYITFGCFQNMAKIGSEVLELWAEVLNKLPNSRLRLQSKSLKDEAVMVNLIERFNQLGIHANRLTLTGPLDRAEYLLAHSEVDLILDTFPFPGGTTTCEALWMGVPTLTLSGNSLISRQGVSLLTAAGLSNWVAESKEDYVNKAIKFASDVQAMATLRSGLRGRVLNSPLYDGKQFAKNMEKILWEMWEGNHSNLVMKSDAKENKNKVPKLVLENKLREDEADNSPLLVVQIVSATRYSESDFWKKSALGQSLLMQLKQDSRLSAKIAYDNLRGLPDVFNECINQAQDEVILVFIHDDVWIDDLNFVDSIVAGLECFDVIGVAGNCRRLPKQPSWFFIDDKFTRDERENLSGRIAHGQNAYGEISYYGDMPAKCELLDGVFLATKKLTLKSANLYFDSRFDFHFYDMDFCRSVNQAGLTLGTWRVKLTHQSGGAFGSSHWHEKLKLYLDKWEVGSEMVNMELNNAIRDVLNLAIRHQQLGEVEQAELLYLEILNIDPENPDANHNLGMIESLIKSPSQAVSRLELAVRNQPLNEKFWVSYIDTLMQSGAIESAMDALTLGQTYGLKTETARTLAEKFVREIDANSNLLVDESNSNNNEAVRCNDNLITTLIPAYKTTFIPQLLLSLATQTFKNFKVIISDDSPNGEVAALINSQEMKETLSYLNVEIIEGPRKGGFPNIFNLVRLYGNQSEFFHILMDDDVIYPTFYEMHMLEHSQSNAQVSVSARWTANQFGQPLIMPMDQLTSTQFAEQFDAASIFKALIPTCNNKLGEWSHAVFRREAAECILNPYINNISYFGLDDIGSFIHAMKNQSGIWIPKPLGFFRRHDAQNTAQINNSTIKCAHYAWISFAIIGVETELIDRKEAWQCISNIKNAINARYSEDKLGIEMLQVLNCHQEYNEILKEDFLSIWQNYLKDLQLQEILEGDLNIKLI